MWQVDMESNGKRVTTSGEPLDYFVGEVDFGEPGTTGQHSFFQLMHMGQAISRRSPVDLPCISRVSPVYPRGYTSLLHRCDLQ